MEGTTITKLDSHSVEVTTTKETKIIIHLDTLEFERESLVRNQAENLAEAESKNAEIQSMIDTLDAKIAQIKGLGVVKRPNDVFVEHIEAIV